MRQYLLSLAAMFIFHVYGLRQHLDDAQQLDNMLSYEEQVHTLFTMLACMRRVVLAAQVTLLQIAMARGLSLRQSQVTAPRRAAER